MDVTLHTTKGDIAVTLFEDHAPKTVASFVGLADGSKAWKDPATGQEKSEPFYDGLTFHRIVAGFVVQGGDPAGDGSGGPGYQFANEISKKVTFADAGMLAYANSGVDTNGSQFFITLAPEPALDPTASASFTIFGKVTKGMDVLQKMGAQPTADNGQGELSVPTQPVYIDSVTIDEKK